ncbi:MAG: hypothetical protein Q7V01_12420 [Vicinamibacterales bacterium]|nr:hypothetical protein [Vicinamibacterales bacterium]
MNPMLKLMEEAAQVLEFKPVLSGGGRGSVRAAPQHLCRVCGQRRSRFFARSGVKADRTHTLCFECYRAVVNRARALRNQAAAELQMLASALPVPGRLRGDREAFHADLRRRRHQAQIAARHAMEGLTGLQVQGQAESSVPLQRVS